MNELAGKVAVVTGGTRGIGRAISLRLAAEGVHVVVNYLSDHSSAEDLIAEINEAEPERGFGRAIAIQAHMGQKESRQELWRTFDEKFSRLDFFIANAATGVFREASSLTLNSIRKVFAVNFEALVDMTNEAVARMPAASDHLHEAGKRGRVVALSSIGAERVIENYGSIGASKAAMEAMIRQLSFELGSKGINCNVVRAGLVDTGVLRYVEGREKIISETIDRTPNGRLVTPEDVAELVAFLLKGSSSMINGQTLTVDGGFGVIA